MGKTLDSIADIFFYVSTAWFIHRLFPHYLAPNNNLMIAFFAIFFLSFYLDTTWFIAFIFLIYLVGFTEEIIIFLKYGEVDPDTPSLLLLTRQEA